MAVSPLNVLSLCAGVGGLDLGVGLAEPEAQTVCYVEWNHFAASVIAARAEDGALDDAPIWDDVGSFDGGPWRGVVDCIAAGFPCQPVSLAGKRQGMADERFIWGDIVRIVREVGPRLIFLENVPGILSADAGQFLGRVLGDVAELGFAAEWDVFSAAETGAPHRRERWFLLGLADDSGDRLQVGEVARGLRRHPARCGVEALADATGHLRRSQRDGGRIAPDRAGDWLGDPEGGRLRRGEASGRGGFAALPSEGLADTASIGLESRCAVSGSRATRADADGTGRFVYPPARNDVRGWAELIAADPSVEPAVCRDADGLAAGVDPSLFTYRADRLRSVGNGVVPLTAALAWTTLAGRLGVATKSIN